MLKQSTKQFDSTNSWAGILKTLPHVCNSHEQQKLFVEKLFNLGGGRWGLWATNQKDCYFLKRNCMKCSQEICSNRNQKRVNQGVAFDPLFLRRVTYEENSWPGKPEYLSSSHGACMVEGDSHLTGCLLTIQKCCGMAHACHIMWTHTLTQTC